MALEYGFFDSKNSDRRYSSNDMNEILEGVINDGIYAGVGDKFYISRADAGLAVTVGTGRAFIHNHWIRNRNPITLTLDRADPALSRIDAIYMVVDERDTERRCYLRVVKGRLSSSPAIPLLDIVDKDVYSLRLGYVRVDPNETRPLPENIINYAGTAVFPFVTSVLQQTDVSALFRNWQDAFMDWWDNIRTVLDGDVAANLANEISLRVRYSDKATATQITNGVGTDGPDEHSLYMSPWEYHVHRISTRVDYNDINNMFGPNHFIGESSNVKWVNIWALDYVIHPIMKEVIFDTAGDHRIDFDGGAPLGNAIDTVILIGGGGGGGALREIAGGSLEKTSGEGLCGQIVVAHNVPVPAAYRGASVTTAMMVRVGNGGNAGIATQTGESVTLTGGRGKDGGDTIFCEYTTGDPTKDSHALIAYGGTGGHASSAYGHDTDLNDPIPRGYFNKGALNIVDSFPLRIQTLVKNKYRTYSEISPFFMSGENKGGVYSGYGSGGYGGYIENASGTEIKPAAKGLPGYAYIRYYTIHPEID